MRAVLPLPASKLAADIRATRSNERRAFFRNQNSIKTSAGFVLSHYANEHKQRYALMFVEHSAAAIKNGHHRHTKRLHYAAPIKEF